MQIPICIHQHGIRPFGPRIHTRIIQNTNTVRTYNVNNLRPDLAFFPFLLEPREWNRGILRRQTPHLAARTVLAQRRIAASRAISSPENESHCLAALEIDPYARYPFQYKVILELVFVKLKMQPRSRRSKRMTKYEQYASVSIVFSAGSNATRRTIPIPIPIPILIRHSPFAISPFPNLKLLSSMPTILEIYRNFRNDEKRTIRVVRVLGSIVDYNSLVQETRRRVRKFNFLFITLLDNTAKLAFAVRKYFHFCNSNVYSQSSVPVVCRIRVLLLSRISSYKRSAIPRFITETRPPSHSTTYT